jgi:uncharacterized membrane protein
MNKIQKFIKKNYWLILIGAIIIYIVVIFSFLSIKYNNFGYDGMDLAIFNQVFYHSGQGNLFHFTIHPHSYLGDHFTPFLLVLLPLYLLFQSPLTLLLLQTIIIALCTIPIYLLAKHNLNKTWALILPLLWLITPMAINMNFFEFHLLPFAMFLLLFTVYFYQKKNLQLFTLFSLLSLSVREDVFLVILMFGVLALFQKRKIKWILSPIILAISWFAMSQMIIGPNNPTGTYKFIPYYNWLGGNSMLAIAKNYLVHPLEVIKHLFILPNIIMFVSLLIPFIFIPILKPKYLLLSSLVYLQFALTKNGGGDIILRTHYVALFIPGIIASFILAIKLIYNNDNINSKFIKILRDNKAIVIIIIIISNIYLLLTLSPIGIKNSNNDLISERHNQEIKQKLLEYIPKYEAVATSYEFLPQLSTRPKLYSLNYAWQGYKQLSYESYEVPKDIEYIYVNFEDILKYDLQYTQDDEDKKYEDSYLKWRKIFEEYNLSPLKMVDTYGIWKYNLSPKKENILYKVYNNQDKNLEIKNPEEININEEITFLGWDKNEINELNELSEVNFQLLPISLYFKKNSDEKIKDNYQLQFSIEEYNKIYPLTYGFYPSSKWNKDEIIKINYWFIIPPQFKKEDMKYTFNLLKLKGNLNLSNDLSFIKNYEKMEILKPDINIVW